MLLKQYIQKRGRGAGKTLADQLEICPSQVYRWLSGSKVPPSRCLQIYEITDGQVTPEELRPDVNWTIMKVWMRTINDPFSANAKNKESCSLRPSVNFPEALTA